MRIAYNKLVRDRIPEIIRRAGSTCATVTLTEEDYRQALRAKLMEEASEAAEATLDHLVVELADLYEVMDALIASYGLSAEMVRAEQAQRREARGGFAQRLCLLWAEDDAQD